MYIEHFATVGCAKSNSNFPAGWWVLPAVVLGTGIWAALIYAIIN